MQILPLPAATYYVAMDGNDSRSKEEAQNSATPWRKIQKAASNMKAGDNCFIRAGIYREMVIVAASGTAQAPITFQAYNNEDVTISGADTVTGWMQESANVYSVPMNISLSYGDQVFQNGVMKPEARWPNVDDTDGTVYPWQNSRLAHPTNNEVGDWSYANTAGYTNNLGWLTDPQLPSRPNGYWNGAQIHIMSGLGWIMWSPGISLYTDSDKKLVTNWDCGSSGAYAILAGNEYYLTGKRGELDSKGEWFNDIYARSVNGAGWDIWDFADQFRYASQPATGDCSISAQVSAIQNTHPWAKAGVMIRESTQAGSVNAGIFVTPSQGVTFQRRTVTGGPTINTLVPGVKAPVWVKLSRVGNAVSAYYSTDGSQWTQVDTAQTITMSASVTRGLAVTSHNTGIVSTGVFTDMGNTKAWPSQDIGSPALAGSSSTGRLSYFSNDGDPGTSVEIKTRHYGLDISGKAYIRVMGIKFFACTIQSDAASFGATFDGITMQYLSHYLRDNASFGLVLRDSFTLRNSELGWDSKGLLRLLGSDIRVINNNLHDSGYVVDWAAMVDVGIGKPNSLAYKRNLISHNTMRDAGRAIMGYPGRAGIVQYNSMFNAMRLTTDGGVFYANLDAGNSIVRYNFFHDSPGPVGHSGSPVMGFYLDSRSANWIVHHNLIWGVPGYDMQMNANHNFNMIFNNTCLDSQGRMLTSFEQDGVTGSHVFNNLFIGTPAGNQVTWALTDFRNNLFTDPLYVAGSAHLQANSPARDAGMVIPGVTDNFLGESPDMGALEYGGEDWTGQVGHKAVPPSPDPAYDMSAMDFANKVKDGGFEDLTTLTTHWTTIGAVALSPRGDAWYDTQYPYLRSGAQSVQFGQGVSIIRQLVTGLLPGRRYKLYAAIRTADSSAEVVLGTRNHGYPALECLLPVEDDRWEMHDFAFTTGLTATSAEIYLQVTSSSSIPVYAEDLAVIREEEVNFQPTAPPLIWYGFDQSSGTSVPDNSSNGRNGTVFGTTLPVWQVGRFGNALHLDGVDDHVRTPSIATPAALTVACWAKSDTATWNNTGCLISQRPAFVLHPDAGTKNVRFVVYSSPSATMNLTWIAPSSFNITQWHHYAGVFNPATRQMELYIDGVLSAAQFATAQSINPDAGVVYVGMDDSLGRYFKGAIDDVRIYGSALSPREIEAIGLPDTSLLVHYAFDENSGAATAWDSSQNRMTGKLVNMAPGTAWVSGAINGALAFDGVDDRVEVSALTSPAAISLACWAKSDSATWNTWGCLISQRSGFVLHPEKGYKDVRLIVYSGPSTAVNLFWNAPPSFDITQWHHYAGVFDPATQRMELYVDGVLASSQATANIALNPDTGTVFIGADEVSGRFLNGRLDDVRIYSRALLWWEILELASQKSRPPYDSTVLPEVANAYHLWLQANGLNVSTPATGSLAGDGIANLVKCSLGLSPSSKGYENRLSFGLLSDEGANNYLSLTYTRPYPALSGVTYAVENSPDLSSGSWTSNGLVEVSNIVDGGQSTVTVRSGTPVAGEPRRFLRLKITQP